MQQMIVKQNKLSLHLDALTLEPPSWKEFNSKFNGMDTLSFDGW